MKLHLTTAENNYLITAYGLGDDGHFIEINKQKYAQNLIVMANQLILDWQSADLSSLSTAHFDAN